MGLTDLQIQKLKPKKVRYEVTDGKGLSIRIKPTGDKAWFYRYRFDRRLRMMKLGDYPGITLAEARKRHAESMQKLQGGADPGVEAREARAKLKSRPSIEEALQEFWEVELRHKKSGGETLRLMNKDVIPFWGSRKVADIKRRHVVLLLDRIRERAPIGCNRVHGALTRFFNFAAERGIIDDSPCTRIRKVAEKGRSRVLMDEEIKTLWAALDTDNEAVDMYAATKLALKIILLTGQRPGEVAGMRWDEIDGDFWNIPPERMKGKEAHRVPLTDMVKSIIEQAKPFAGNSQYVFTSPRSPLYGFKKPKKAKPKDDDAPMTAHCLSRAVNRHWLDMGFATDARFTPHDLRRTLRTRLAELGVSDVVAERVLGHKLQGILGVYNRHSYDVEKRQALAMWERRLSAILGHPDTPSNVLQFEVRNGKAI